MFLKRLRLQNFKCLGDIELSFETEDRRTRKWTLILGENGTGKSNVLKAVALLTAGSGALGELLGDIDNWIRFGAEEGRVHATIVDESGHPRELTLRFGRGMSLSPFFSHNMECVQVFDSDISPFLVVAYGANRRVGGDSSSRYEKQSRPASRSNKIRSLFDGNATLNPLPAWVMDLDYQTDGKALGMLTKALEAFLPNIRFHRIDKQRKQVLFETRDGIIPFEQLSEGYQNMAAWIGDLLYRITETFPGIENPLEARGLLLLDEIDVHLHPRWQRQLIDFVSKQLPNFQIIATTHSPLTAQQAGEDELYALRRTEDGPIELLPFRGSPRNLLVNQLLMTPVFGLDTDESLEVELSKAGAEGETFRGEDDFTEPTYRSIDPPRKKVRSKREMLETSQKELDLLERISAALDSKEKK